MSAVERQLQAINPSIAEIMQRHESHSRSPLNPLEVLASAAGTTQDYGALIGPLRSGLSGHFEELDSLQLDYKPVLAASYLVNLLTEDNLPEYKVRIDKIAEKSPELSAWLGRWTAEEYSHGTLLRDYGLLSGLIGGSDAVIDHDSYQSSRNSQLAKGTNVAIDSLAKGFAYTALQEDATFQAHISEALLLDKIGGVSLRRIAGDEANHHQAYSSMASAMLNHFPDETVIAIRDVFFDFSMPGEKGIPNFSALARTIAVSGLFDVATIKNLKAKLVGPKIWDIENRQFDSNEAKRAQQELLDGDPRDDRKISILNSVRQKLVEKSQANGGLRPFILGVTVTKEELRAVA